MAHRLDQSTRAISRDGLGLSKRRKRRVCRDPAPSDNPSHSDTDLTVPFAEDSTQGDEEQDAHCVFCTGRSSEDHNGED